MDKVERLRRSVDTLLKRYEKAGICVEKLVVFRNDDAKSDNSDLFYIKIYSSKKIFI